MKNISVTVDDDTHRRLRIMAAEKGTSVSALIREHIRGVVLNRGVKETAAETEPERRRRRLQEFCDELQRKGIRFSAADRLTREELYHRGAPR